MQNIVFYRKFWRKVCATNILEYAIGVENLLNLFKGILKDIRKMSKEARREYIITWCDAWQEGYNQCLKDFEITDDEGNPLVK